MISVFAIIYSCMRVNNQSAPDSQRGGFLVFCCMFMLPYSLYLFYSDWFSGVISFDKEKVTLTLLFRKIIYQYSDCADMGFCMAQLRRSKAICVYLSKAKMTEQQRIQFFQTPANRMGDSSDLPIFKSDYIQFKYYPDVFKEFVNAIPERFKERLIKDEQKLTTKLVFFSEELTNVYSGKKVNMNDVPINGKGLSALKLSNYYRDHFGVLILIDLMIILFYFMIRFLQKSYSPFDLLLMKLLGPLILVLTVSLIWIKMTSFLLGKYSFDREKVVFQTPIKKMEIHYEECNEIRVMRWNKGPIPLVYICMTKNQLPDENDRWLFVKPGWMSKRKDLPQYGKDFMMIEVHDVKEFKSFIGMIPEKHRTKMIEDARRIFGDN